jgi:hypothetical protein
MIDFEEAESFFSFLTTLSDSQQIDLDSQYRIRLNNKDQFKEFGFGLYLLWLHIHKRPRTPLLYFTGIGSDQTLFLVSPYQDNPYFCSPKGYRPGQLYVDALEGCFKTNPNDCQFCDLRNSLLVNISYFKHTNAFKEFLTDQRLGQIKGDFPKIRNCAVCKPRYFSWLKRKIREDDRQALCLGGYPVLLDTPAKPFELLFREPREADRLKVETGNHFDSYLTVYLAEKFGSTKYTANAAITSPFASFEIDSAVLVEEKSGTNLLVIETASYYHDLKTLKNKLLNYAALSRRGYNRFIYIYLTITQSPKVSIRRETRELQETDRDLGALSSIMTENNFKYLNLPPAYKDLDTNLVTDWWDKEYLRSSYDYLMARIEELTDQLRAEQLP